MPVEGVERIREQKYFEEWIKIHSLLCERGFTWGSIAEKGEEHQYLLLDLYRMPKETYQRILEATEKIGHIYQKTVVFLQNSPSLFSALHLPKNTWKAVQLPSPLFSYFARMDLVVRNDGEDIKILEMNSDTPTGIVEAAVANDVVCGYFGESSPNRLIEEIKRTFQRIKTDHEIPDEETVYFLSYDWHEEDRQTTEFLRWHSGFSKTQYLPIKDLRVSTNGVYTSNGELVKYLYRLYPLEYFSADKGPNGEPIGDLFLEHVAEGRVKLINPPSAFLGQCKTTMAVIWALHENGHPFFTGEEHQMIEKYFLPTYPSAEGLAAPLVQKPVWGREGGGVSIVGKDGSVIEDRTPYYYQQPKIYQKYIELPTVTVRTWEGPYTGSLLFGSFLIGGSPAGIFPRVGEKITGNLSMFLPVAVK
ncbi:glutathionylspermidine synthase family protein [Hydrogenibacillus schlegelii]|nr:glutathionylspermidine synthase family protein [Hydrogenibacillus schlegelii]